MAFPRQAGRISRPCSSTFLVPRRFRNARDFRYEMKSTRHLSCYVNSRARVHRQRSHPSVIHGRAGHRPPDNQTSNRSARRHASFWGWRMQSYWHRPGCKWVQSEGDLRRTPRDKDCPACQYEENRPTELSHRELVWQRQMQFMREFLEKDPYQALFGRSNDRLRGIIPRSLLTGNAHHPWLVKHFQLPHASPTESNQDPKDRSQPPSRSNAKVDSNKLPVVETTPTRPNPRESKTASKEKANQTLSKPAIQGYGTWKVSATDSSGKTVVESGEMVYDPISMRMVPCKTDQQSSAVSEEIKSPSEQQGITDPTREVLAPAKKNVPIEETRTKPENISVNKAPGSESIQRKATSTTPKETTNQTPSAPSYTIPEQKFALIHKVESELSVAQSQLKDLISVEISNPIKSRRMVSVGKALTSLHKTQTALETLNKSAWLNTTVPVSRISQDTQLDASKPSLKTFEENSPVPIKNALEKSWVQAQDTARPAPSPEAPVPLQPASAVNGDSSSTGKSAHYRQAPESPVAQDRSVRECHRMLHRRDRAWKHMSSRELSDHRTALLKAWEKKHGFEHKKETPAEKKLKHEVNAQKMAMAKFESKAKNFKPKSEENTTVSATKVGENSTREGDVSPKVAKFAKYERWYKQKAPHALKVEQEKLEDQALAIQIKEIYEMSYGVINEKHRQPKVAQSVEKPDLKLHESRLADEESSKRLTASKMTESNGVAKQTETRNQTKEPVDQYLYQILAYDSSTQSVHSAIASASYSPPTGDKILSVVEALPRLGHPAKFLPYLSEHQSKGYEVVSANKNLLVLKRINSSSFARAEPPSLKDPTNTATTMDDAHTTLEGAKTQQSQSLPKTSTGNFASPTGFVNHDIYDMSSSSSTTNVRSNPISAPSPQQKVRKEEPVFTGRSNKPLEKNTASQSQPAVAAVKINGGGSSSGRSTSSGYRFRRGNRRSFRRKVLKTILFGGITVVIGSYLRGWWVDNSGSASGEASKPSVLYSHVENGDSDTLDNADEDSRKISSKAGFWAAVNREQARRTEAAEARAEMQRIVNEESKRRLAEQEFRRKAMAAAGAGVEIALFGTFLWAVMKLLESGK